MVKKKLSKTTVIIAAVIIVLAAVVILGLIGSSQASNVGITCDFGLGKDGSVFCWKWHKNAIGNIADAIGSITGKK